MATFQTLSILESQNISTRIIYYHGHRFFDGSASFTIKLLRHTKFRRISPSCFSFRLIPLNAYLFLQSSILQALKNTRALSFTFGFFFSYYLLLLLWHW